MPREQEVGRVFFQAKKKAKETNKKIKERKHNWKLGTKASAATDIVLSGEASKISFPIFEIVWPFQDFLNVKRKHGDTTSGLMFAKEFYLKEQRR